jgi:hypothetical protein
VFLLQGIIVAKKILEEIQKLITIETKKEWKKKLEKN